MMHRNTPRRTASILALCALPFLATDLLAQSTETPAPTETPKPAEPGQDEKGKKDEKPKADPKAPEKKDANDPKAMLKALEKDMAAVEALLLQAQARPSTGLAGSKQKVDVVIERIDKLLDNAKKAESKIISDLDRLIKEVQKRQREQQQKQQQQQQQKQQQNQRNQRNKQQREGQNEREKKRYNNKQEESRPENNEKRDQGNPDKRKTDVPSPKDPTERSKQPNKAGVWGRLPDKLFRLLTSREQTIFPPEFRSYIERYYRRLAENKK